MTEAEAEARLDELRKVYQAERAIRLELQRELDEARAREYAAREKAARAEGRADRLESEVKALRDLLMESARTDRG